MIRSLDVTPVVHRGPSKAQGLVDTGRRVHLVRWGQAGGKDPVQNSRNSYIPHGERPVSRGFTLIHDNMGLNKAMSLAVDCFLDSCHVYITRL